MLKRKGIRNRVRDVLRNGDQLGEGALTSKLLAGNSEHLPVFAKVDRSGPAGWAFAAGDGRIERHSVSGAEAGDVVPHCRDDSGGFVPHHQRGDSATGAAVEPVDIATADTAGSHRDEQVLGADGRLWQIGNLQLFWLGQQESFQGEGPRRRIRDGWREVPAAVFFEMGYNRGTGSVSLLLFHFGYHQIAL